MYEEKKKGYVIFKNFRTQYLTIVTTARELSNKIVWTIQHRRSSETWIFAKNMVQQI